jgi:mRNA interferase MazF
MEGDSDVVALAFLALEGGQVLTTRPCLVISGSLDNHRHTDADGAAKIPHVCLIRFLGKEGEMAVDQIQTVDKSRLVRTLGELGEQQARKVTSQLAEMFARD